MNKKKSFEEALEKLEAAGEKLTRGDLTLEEAIEEYEMGIKHYEECMEILETAKQKIQVCQESGEES